MSSSRRACGGWTASVRTSPRSSTAVTRPTACEAERFARAGDGHPPTVRLAPTPPFHPPFARRATSTERLGLLTKGFAAVVREAGLALDRLTWDAVSHRVREHAIQARRYEEQWVTLSG